MPPEKPVVIDMDQTVSLTIRVSVGQKFLPVESLTQEFTAPLFIIKNVLIGDIAEELRCRVMAKYMNGLREEEERRMQEEGESEDDIRDNIIDKTIS